MNQVKDDKKQQKAQENSSTKSISQMVSILCKSNIVYLWRCTKRNVLRANSEIQFFPQLYNQERTELEANTTTTLPNQAKSFSNMKPTKCVMLNKLKA